MPELPDLETLKEVLEKRVLDREIAAARSNHHHSELTGGKMPTFVE